MYECLNIQGNTWYFPSPANIGLVKTGDTDVVLIDSIPFLYDVKGFLQTLTVIEQTPANFFIPSHADPTRDIHPLVDLNREKVNQLCELIVQFCDIPIHFEALLKKVFDHYGLSLNFNQYVLAGSTLKSFLSYLYDLKQVDALFTDNMLLWVTVHGV